MESPTLVDDLPRGTIRANPARTTLLQRAGLGGLVVWLTPCAVWACPVCFGASDGPVAAGLNTAVLFMMGVTTLMLGAVGAFAWRLGRLARRARAPQRPGVVATPSIAAVGGTAIAPSPGAAAC